MTTQNDISDVIEQLGGRGAIAEAAGVTKARVSQVKAEGLFPVAWLRALEQLAEARSVPRPPDSLFRWKSRGDGEAA